MEILTVLILVMPSGIMLGGPCLQYNSCLDKYRPFYVIKGWKAYFEGDFRESRIKLLARTKTLPINEYHCRMNISQNDIFDLCT